MINYIKKITLKYLPNWFHKLYFYRKMNNFMKNNFGAIQIVSFRGCQFFSSKQNKIEAALIDTGNKYDFTNFEIIAKFVKKGSICFDVGANIGVYSVVMAHLGGVIHSFEPVTYIRQKLEANVLLNQLSSVFINDFALGAEEDTAEMYQVNMDEFRGGTSTLVYNENVKSMGENRFTLKQVNVKTLDSYVENKNIEKVDFIKIDVEGFEWPVLCGSKKIIKIHTPAIIMEFDPIRHSNDAENFRNFFDEYSYSVYETIPFYDKIVFVPFRFNRKCHGRNVFCMNMRLD
jgi:FkbM family methyltransferase